MPLLVLIVVLAIGGGIYYSHSKQTLSVENNQIYNSKPATDAETNTTVNTQTEVDTSTGTDYTPSQNQQRATITLLTPSKNQTIDISSPMKITWKTSNNFTFPQVTITVVTSDNGQAAFDSITVPNTGSAMITVPKSVGVVPYKILIQGAPYSGRGEAPFAYSDEFFFTGGMHAQMGR